jgi:hypothetical protein
MTQVTIKNSRTALMTGITVAVSQSVTALQLSVALDARVLVTYRHLFPVGVVQPASAARRAV